MATDAPLASAVARLLRPRSIAIVGVSEEPGSIGGAVLANLDRFGFPGALHLVSRGRSAVGGRPCLPAVDALPADVDVAVLALPGAAIPDTLAACRRRGVGSAVVFAAGFAETGDAGQAAQVALAQIARDCGMALLGPNCLGGVNYAAGVPLTYEPVVPLPQHGAPSVGIVAQSGAMASSLRFALLGKGLGLSLCMSTGNEAVLGIEDFLAALVDDDRTRAVAVFAEQIRSPARFLAIAGRARAAGKAIVLMHPGRSQRARESGRTHTGALATDHGVMRALLSHGGVILVDTMEELIDATELLARFPRASAQGVGIITNSGAFKSFALDFCAGLGLDVPALAPATQDALRAVLPAYAAIDNPLDTTGQTIKQPSIFSDTGAALLADPGVGSLVVAIVPGSPAQADAKLDALLPALSTTTKPAALAVMGDEVPLPDDFATRLRRAGVPFFRAPERALRAMAHATAFARRATDAGEVSAVVLPSLALPRAGALAEHEGKAILTQLGIAVPRGALAQDLAHAAALADDIGYPVCLKAQSAALLHKTEAGAVILDVRDAAALAGAWERLMANVAAAKPELALDGVLVEAMAPRGLEMILGGRRDPDWGPVVIVGLGGIFVEAIEDVLILPPDLPPAAIAQALGSLKGARLLGTFRGAPARDVAAVAEAAAHIGALMRARPEIAEIDINPLLVLPRGQGVLALDVLLVTDTRT